MQFEDLDWESILANSAAMDCLNILAGVASGASSIVADTEKISTQADSIFACRLLAGTIAGMTEAVYDSVSYLINWIFKRFAL